MNECPYCHKDLKLKDQRRFDRHKVFCKKYQKHIDNLNNGKFKCELCQREFQCMKSIFAHLSKLHFKEFSSRQLDWKCNICDQRYDKKSIKRHKKLCGKYSMHITHVDGKWACNFCGQLLRSQSSMFHHLAKKHEEEREEDQSKLTSNEIILDEFSDKEDMDEEEEEDYGYLDGDVEVKIEPESSKSSALSSPLKLKIQKALYSSNDKSSEGSEESPEVVQENDNESPPLHLQKSIQNEDKTKPDDFPGSIFQVFCCEMCDTPFINQDYVIDHLKTYHKYQKDCSNFIRIKKL